MRKLSLTLAVICLLGLLMIPLVSANTTYHEADIDTQGRNLTIIYEDNTYVFLKIEDTKPNGYINEYLLLDSHLESEGLVYNEITGMTPYVIEYTDIVKISILATDDGFNLDFEVLFEELVSTSVISLTYTLNDAPMTLDFTVDSEGVYNATLQITEAVTEAPISILDQIIEWFRNLNPF